MNTQLYKVLDSRYIIKKCGVLESNDIGLFIKDQQHVIGDHAYAIIYRFDCVRIDEVKNGTFVTYGDLLTEIKQIKALRCFSPRGEVYVFRANDTLQYRCVVDTSTHSSDATGISIYDEEHFLIGTEPIGDNTVTDPGRGSKIQLPFDITEDDLPIRYRVRNYITYDWNGLIQFCDARLVNFQTSQTAVFNRKGADHAV